MASSERVREGLHARRPWVLVAIAFAVFLVLDNAIFRSGLYLRIASTRSVAGHFAVVARFNLATPPSDKRQVLVLGHSKIEAALSARTFEEENPDSRLQIVMGSSGGTTEKIWYYLLKHIDPDRRRFAAIVVPIDTYKTPPVETDCDNQIDVAQLLAPMLDLADWRDLIGTYTDPEVRGKVVLGAAVSSHLYALDIQDLFLHPVMRYDELAWANAVGARFLYDFDGFEGDLTGLEIDRANAKIIQAPPHLDPFRRGEAEGAFHGLPPESVGRWTQRYYEFRRRWFTRIIDYYTGSETKLVFVQVPRWPFDMPALLPLDGAPDLRDFVKPSRNVAVLDEKEFEDLEEPRYFYDVLHVNKIARREFTTRFAKDLRSLLGD